MLGLIAMSLWLRMRHRLYDATWFLRLCQFTGPLWLFCGSCRLGNN